MCACELANVRFYSAGELHVGQNMGGISYCGYLFYAFHVASLPLWKSSVRLDVVTSHRSIHICYSQSIETMGPMWLVGVAADRGELMNRKRE